jgi:hypothetical protein
MTETVRGEKMFAGTDNASEQSDSVIKTDPQSIHDVYSEPEVDQFVYKIFYNDNEIQAV